MSDIEARTSYDRAIAAAEAMYTPEVELLAHAGITGYVDQTGGMCLAITVPATGWKIRNAAGEVIGEVVNSDAGPEPADAPYVLITAVDGPLPWNRETEPVTAWMVGAYHRDNDFCAEGPDDLLVVNRDGLVEAVRTLEALIESP